MANFLSPGEQISQVAKGPVVLPAIATAISGFLTYAQKGPVGQCILVTSPDDAKEVFGGRITAPGNSRLTDTLIDYFSEGGASCYLVRFIGAGSATAARNLSTVGGATSGSETSNASTFPVGLSPGDTFVGVVDGGSPHTVTIAATRATVTGSGGTFSSVTASHHLDVTVAAIPGNQVITFAGTENTEQLFINTINAQLRGARAVDSGGQIKLETDQEGSGAAGSILGSTSADVLTSLGFSAGAWTNAGPNNVANVDAVQASELRTQFNTTFTGSTSTANANNSLTWASSTTGTSSSVQFTSGSGVAKVAGFDTSLHSGTTTAAVPTATLTAASGPYSSPGSWANSYGSQVTKVNTIVTTVAATSAGSTSVLTVASTARLFIGDTISITKSGDTERGVISTINGLVVTLQSPITVPGGGYAGNENVVQETFNVTVYDPTGLIVSPSPYTNLRMSPLAGPNYFVNVINSAARTPVIAADLSASAADPRPNTDSTAVLFSGGSDGSPPTASDVVSYVSAFNQVSDVSFISCPGANTDFTGSNGVSILKALELYTTTRADLMCILSTPKGTPAIGSGGVKDYVQNTANLASSYEAIYWPWIKCIDAVSGTVVPFPPEPHVQGIIARTHKNRNFGKAPAGTVDGRLAGSRVVDVEFRIAEQSPEYNDFYPANVNAILNFPGEGICVYGSRANDPTGEFNQINVQTVFNVNKRLCKKLTRFVVFENNNPGTRASVVRRLTATLREQRLSGILQGSKDSEAFFIICDDSNNTAAVIAQGKLRCRVGLAVERPAEFLDFTFEQDTRAIDAALAALSTGTT